MPYLIDTHCHLNLDDFKNDLNKVIERAKSVGVRKMVIVGTSAVEDRRVFDLCMKSEGLFATAGYHPYYLKDLNDEEIEIQLGQIEEMIGREGVVAVGEIGLDYYYEFLDKELQRKIFVKMLGLAKKYDKPIVVHSRNSFEDVLEILKNEGPNWRGVMHCFTGGPKVVQKVLDLGLHAGYTGLITYTKDRALLDSVGVVPMEKILVETDAPWLSPEPYRGRRCEPAFVVETAKMIAQMKEIAFEDFCRITSINAEKLFGF